MIRLKTLKHTKFVRRPCARHGTTEWGRRTPAPATAPLGGLTIVVEAQTLVDWQRLENCSQAPKARRPRATRLEVGRDVLLRGPQAVLGEELADALLPFPRVDRGGLRPEIADARLAALLLLALG